MCPLLTTVNWVSREVPWLMVSTYIPPLPSAMPPRTTMLFMRRLAPVFTMSPDALPLLGALQSRTSIRSSFN